MNALQISVVAPAFNERESVAGLLSELLATLDEFGRSYEILVVDDGSVDGTGAVVGAFMQRRPEIRLIRFRRNFGQSAAFDAGFRRSRGEIIVTLDADGQNDPADIPRLIRHLEANDLDFVSGERGERKDAAFTRKAPSRVANWIIRRVTRTGIRDLGCSLKAYRAAVVQEIRLYGEMHRFLSVLIEGTGARIGQIKVNHRARKAGKSKYGLSRTFKVLLDLVTVWFMRGFQTSPIYAFGGLSLALFVAAAALSAVVLLEKWFRGIYVHRNPLFILSMISAIVAVQLMAMGLIAELLIRTYFEARGKPAYLIESELGAASEPPTLSRTLPVEVTLFARRAALESSD